MYAKRRWVLAGIIWRHLNTVCLWCTDNMNPISVDFTKKHGKLRPRLHGAGYMPNMGSASYLGFADEFSKLNFHEARTHDQALANPGQRVIDTHFVFPNINADPAELIHQHCQFFTFRRHV